MKKTITFLSFLLLAISVNAQVSTLFTSATDRYWLTFMFQNNRPSGDLLYYKSKSQPNTTLNSFDVTIGRYKMSTQTEIMTITLKGMEGIAYSSSNIVFLPSISGIATDNAGNIYVTAYNSKKIYRYNAPSQTTGSISLNPSYVYTLPSSNGYQPLAFDGSGNLYIGNGALNIYRVLAGDLTSNVTLSTPFLTLSGMAVYDIAFDKPGNLYVAGGGKEIRKFSATGALLSTISYDVASTNIFSLAVAADGTVFFTTGNSNTIAKYNPTTGTSAVFAGSSGVSGDALDASTTPPYSNARFGRVSSITLGGNGILLGYDENTRKVYKIVAGVVEATLPLFLTHFNVAVSANAATYKWAMASQTDVVKYVLQSSTDGGAFNDVATVLPVPQQLSYSYADNAFKSEVYVRLKVVYGNGEEEFSDIQFLKNKLEKNQFQASLNPNRLTVKNDIPGHYTLKIIGLDGKVLFSKSQYLEKGSNFVNLNLGVVNSSNIYIVNCIGNQQNHSVKTIAN